MSFILDALRKSDHERQRQTGPGIAELPIARPASRAPVALIAVGALLAINLVIVLVLVLRQGAPEATVPASAVDLPAASSTPVATPPFPEPPPLLSAPPGGPACVGTGGPR